MNKNDRKMTFEICSFTCVSVFVQAGDNYYVYCNYTSFSKL